MKPVIIATALCAVVFSLPASADPIETACLSSKRPGVSRALCGCIQDAANLTLSTKDQRMAAKFFRDPHKSQEMRTSDRQSDDAFWKRYRNFGATAETFCRG